MTDMIKTGANWLETKRLAHRAVTVTVRRGGLSFTADATKGMTQLIAATEDNVIVQEKSEDFTIAVADYDFGWGPVDPEPGDMIYDDSSGSTVVLEVLPMAVEAEKRYSDGYRISWRIHTKEAL